MAKKIGIIRFLIASLFIFAGCSQIENPKNPKNEKQSIYEVIHTSGTLKALGVNLGEKGTHLIQEENGTITLLYSESINLNDEEYLNKKVTLSGILKKKEGSKDVIQVETIQILPPDESLKTYEDTTLGFAVTYPALLIPEQLESRVVFRDPDNAAESIVITRTEIPKETSLETYLETIELDAKKRNPVSIGQEKIPGYQTENKSKSIVDIFIKTENGLYTFSHVSLSKESFERFRDYFNTMVKSFILIPLPENTTLPENPLTPQN